MKWVYGFMALVGLIVPIKEFVLWVIENGFNISLFLKQAMANRISIFAWLDVIICVLVIIIMTIHKKNESTMRGWWIPIIASVTVGASLGLPLLLFMQEFKKKEVQNSL